MFAFRKYRTIAVRQLRPGNVVRFGDGNELEVASSKFGDGLISYGNRTARVAEILFTNGLAVKAHPGENCKIRR